MCVCMCAHTCVCSGVVAATTHPNTAPPGLVCVCVSHPRKVEEYLNLMYMSSYSVYSKVAFLRKTRKDHCNLVLGVQHGEREDRITWCQHVKLVLYF